MKKIGRYLRIVIPKILWVALYGLIIAAYVWPLASIANTVKHERVLWDKRPIPLALAVGDERLVHFPTDVRYWIPESIRDHVSIISANGVVYITALAAFDESRIRVQSMTTHTMYLVDVRATESDTHYPDLVVTDKEHVVNSAKERDEEESSTGDWFVRLTRFASQKLYAPERLHPKDSEVNSIRLTRRTPIPLIRGGFIEATPLSSWRGGGLTVTAIQLRNLTSEEIRIVHEANQAERAFERLLVIRDDVRGDWLAITAQHQALKASGKHADTTTLYVISQRSFEENKERF